MNQLRWPLFAACLVVAASVSAVAPQRTFVASYGVDTNPCSLAAPCRGFQAAINAVAVGGEVVAIDTAGYGAMEIHKSVSVIVPPGVQAGLSPSTGIPLPGYPGQYGVVFIDIQDSDVVILRGLNINHQGTVTGGIEWISTQGGTVQIENTTINGFPYEGVYAETAHGKLFINDSIIRNNVVGIFGTGEHFVGPTGVFADNVRVENSTYGIRLTGNTTATLSNSKLTANTRAISLQANMNAVLHLQNCNVYNNGEVFKIESLFDGSKYPLAEFLTVGSSIIGGGYTGEGDPGVYIVSYGGNFIDSGPTIFNLTFPPL